MRILLKVSFPIDKANATIKDGSLPKKMQAILAEQKPEAAYFTTVDGLRGGYIVVNLQDASQLPAYAEPWFLAFNATVEAQPVMLPEDIAKAGPAIERAVKNYA